MLTPIDAARFLVLALLLTGSQLALAQDRSPDQLIEAGVSARRAGNDEQALALFTQAWAAGHAPRARAQMALAEQALGNYVEANLYLGEALAATGDAWIDQRRAALEEGLVTVRARLGQLDVRSEQPGARLQISGRDAGALPLAAPLWLMPGTITVEVSAPGFASSARTVTLTAGQLTRERFELVATAVTAVPVTTPPPVETTQQPGDDDSAHSAIINTDSTPTDEPRAAQREERTGSALPAIGWITAGVGAVGLGVMGYLIVDREANVAKYNDDARCLIGTATREERCSRYSEAARGAELPIAVTFVGGTLLVLGGLAMAIFGGGGSDRESEAGANTATPAPDRASLSCSPVFGTVAGAACEGTF